MERPLRQRIVGATVLVALAVIFLPMLLQGPDQPAFDDARNIIPPEPRPKGNMPRPPVLSSVPSPLADESTIESSAESGAESRVAEGDALPPQAPAAAQGATPAPLPQSAPMPEKAAAPAPARNERKAGLPTPPPASELVSWVVQLASFSTLENAERLRDTLRKEQHPAYVEGPKQHGGKLFRVRVGPLIGYEQAKTLRDRLKREHKLDGVVIRLRGKE